MSKGRGNLGIVHEKVYDFWENDESGYNCKHEEKRKKTGEQAKRYCDRRRLITRDGMTSFWKLHKGNRAVQVSEVRKP